MVRAWLGPVLVVALVASVGAAAALPADKHLVVEADNGQGCKDVDKNDCYRVTEGSLEGFVPGMDVHIILENVGSADHNLFVTEQANADENNADTAAEDAINGSETIAQGETTNLTFTVPDDAEGLYFWCDVDTHEPLGMWMEAQVATEQQVEPSDPADEGNETGSGNVSDDGSSAEGDDVGRFLPAPGALVALLASGLATVVALRREP
ncbi:hypothetical protein BRD56_00005 [Thermoplasmatales archaeon SW_10_69_26]|nr:MAG: hypothetical protein BRD56_00005 [Thermoplasmatales archaeon SW_10_69_26]